MKFSLATTDDIFQDHVRIRECFTLRTTFRYGIFASMMLVAAGGTVDLEILRAKHLDTGTRSPRILLPIRYHFRSDHTGNEQAKLGIKDVFQG